MKDVIMLLDVRWRSADTGRMLVILACHRPLSIQCKVNFAYIFTASIKVSVSIELQLSEGICL